MTVYVDADACPVIKQAEKIAKKYNLKTVLLCDTNHTLISDYSETVIVGAGADAVDFALINRCNKGDIVITQDYGVGAMALGKKAYAIHQNGMWYTNKNIDILLSERFIKKKARMSSSKHHIKGPKKRTLEDNLRFEESFEKLILYALGRI